MIRLEKFQQGDYKQLINWISDEEMMTSWSGALFNFPLTENKLDWYSEKSNIPGESDAFIFKAVAPNDETIGHISLGGISWKNRSARVTRVFIAPTARGKGYCQEMTKAVLKIGFEELKLHRLEIGVYDNNTSALACYEKAGFKREGISRDILWYKNEWRSMVEMSLLENEWKTGN